MADHVYTPNRPTKLTRRTLATGACASVGLSASPVGFGAEAQPDAALLALAPRLASAVYEASACNMSSGVSDEVLDGIEGDLSDACEAIVRMPAACTEAGRALKAAAAMHKLLAAYEWGKWAGLGEELAWKVLGEIAGDAYAPVEMRAHLMADWHPGRA